MNKVLLLNKQVYNLSIFILFLMIFLLGSGMNFIAVTKNGGKMPVMYKEFEFESEKHFSFTDCSQVDYCYLTDVFPIGDYIFSLGDFLIIFSLILEILMIIRIIKTRKKIKVY